MKINKGLLLDDFHISGDTFKGFEDALIELDRHTSIEHVFLDDFFVFSVKGVVGEKEDEGGRRIAGYLINPKNLYNENGLPNVIPKGIREDSFNKDGSFDKLIDEATNQSKLILLKGKKAYFTARALPLTVGLRSGMAGDFLLEPSLARDMVIAERLAKGTEATVISREYKRVKKSLAMLSSKYTYIPQTILSDIIAGINEENLLGETRVYKWNISNDISDIYVEFPEKAKELQIVYGLTDEYIPGLWVQSSDNGSSSLIIKGTWRLKGSISVGCEFARKHAGNIDLEKIEMQIVENIFDQYTKMPAKLCELMKCDLSPDSLTTKKELTKNKEIVTGYIKDVLKEIGIVAAIGKGNEKDLYEELCMEVNPTIQYTAYDIVTMIMTLPDRIDGLNDCYKNNFVKAVGKAPYVKCFDKKDSSKIVLIA